MIEIRPLVAVPASQAYYWSEDWQAREREVDTLLTRGEFTEHADVDAFLGHLDALDTADEGEEAKPAQPVAHADEHVGTTR